MQKKYRILFLIITMTFTTMIMGAGTRTKYNFNSSWLLYIGDKADAQNPVINDSSWKTVTLPRAFNEDQAFKEHIENLTDTVVWYRKHFRLSRTDKDKKVFIEFEGVRFAAKIYLNGHFIGMHENGVMAFGFDLTPFISFDKENVISVRVDNNWDYREESTGSKYQWNNRNFNANYGGIPKNVFLHLTGKIYQTLPLYSSLKTTGSYIYANDLNITERSANVHVESQIKNETSSIYLAQLEICLTDPDGKTISTFRGMPEEIKPDSMAVLKAENHVKGLHFWSWGYGYLYKVQTRVLINGKIVDEQTINTGFRKTHFERGMIWLNDRVIQMKGYAQRTSNEWPGVGMSIPPWLSDFSNGMIVEGNGNMVRWMHVTPWKQDIESCDRVGLMQMFPAGDAEKDAKGRQWEQRKELMRDAIIYNRNNPSIILYECGNESISEEHMLEMKEIRDEFDPMGGRAIGSREMLDSKKAEYGGEMLYINHSAKHPLIATEYCRDEGLRKYWDELSLPFHKNGAGPLYRNADASPYNRNMDSFAEEDIIRWNDYYICRPGTGKRVSSGGLNIVFSDTNTHCRGEENYRRSGETDAMRIPKDAFFAHQVMWDGWVDLEKMNTYIIGHWNYDKGTIKDIKVVSPADRVELFLNKKSLGFGEKSHNFLHTFKSIQYEAGELIALSYHHGMVVSQDIKSTAGLPAALKLKMIPRPMPIKADGADMVLIEVEVVDKNGQRCPNTHPLVDFELTGPAEWRGGIGQGPDNYVLSKTLPAECGVNRALIRTRTQNGDIHLKASSKGLNGAILRFRSEKQDSRDGLTEHLPAEGLKGNLSRGETPSNPSFLISRKTLEVVSVEAGANQKEAELSIDDNELSSWSSDGNRNNAWIRYELKEKDSIASVVAKLNGWRSISYPIEILVDGNLVWKGNTPLSLGYVTMNFKAAIGKSITMRLAGANSQDPSFDNMIELSGKREDDGIDEKDRSGNKLRIVELEFYAN